MIHLNGNSKPSSSSTMCSRRDKGMVQTSIILILLAALGYGFYLHNLLQAKVKYMDIKALEHQSNEHSLSSQLQAAYEARARSEKLVLESKKDYRELQDEKESIIQEMLIEHQDKNDVIKQENKELQAKNAQLLSNSQDLKRRHDRVYKDQEELKGQHQKALRDHAEAVNKAHEELERYKSENKAIRNVKYDLEQQIQEANGNYQKLQDAMKALPADVVDFNHPVVRNLNTEVKEMILSHLGERRGDLVHVQQPAESDQSHTREEEQPAQEQRPAQQQGYGLQEQENVAKEQYEGGAQPTEQVLVDRGFPDAITVDICALKVDRGPCHSDEVRFAYHTGFNECRGFTYGGCGGNENNFENEDECRSICSDPARRYVKKTISVEEKAARSQQINVVPDEDGGDDLPRHQQPNGHAVQDFRQTAIQEEHPEADEAVLERDQETEQPDKIDELIHPDDYHHQERFQEQDQNLLIQAVKQVDEGQENDEPDEETDLSRGAEIRAIAQEEAAKRELEQQQSNQQIDQQWDRRPSEKLYDSQKHDVDDVVDQEFEDEQNQIKARVVDNVTDKNGEDEEAPSEYNEEAGDEDEKSPDQEEEEDDNDMEDGFAKQEKDVQVVLPPAARVAEHDPEAVANIPPARHDEIDSDEVNGRNIFEREDENGLEMQGGGDPNYEQENPQEDEDDPGVHENAKLGDEYEEDQNAGFQDDDKTDEQV